MRKDWGLLVYF